MINNPSGSDTNGVRQWAYVNGFPTVNQSVTSTTSVDLNQATVTLTTGARRLWINFDFGAHPTVLGNQTVYVEIQIDGVVVKTWSRDFAGEALATGGDLNVGQSISFSRSFMSAVQTAAAHTVKLSVRVATGVTWVIVAAEGTLTVMETDLTT